MNSRSGIAAGVANQTDQQSRTSSDLLGGLYAGRSTAFVVQPDGRWMEDGSSKLVLAGSFNPLHCGHLELANIASRITGLPPAFELCVMNVDKAALGVHDVWKRVRQFAWKFPVWITRTPTFVEKASFFPNAIFAVGADTAERIVNPRYYGGRSDLLNALQRTREQGCRFLVASRRQSHQRALSLGEIDIPWEFRDLFDAIPQAQFLMDISSTDVREKRMTSNGQPREQEPERICLEHTD